MTDPLTTAVHRLTRETRTKVIQDGDGDVQSVAIVVHAPLLTRLAEAVTSSLGSGGGGGGGKAEKNVLDSEAMYHSALITSAIGDWCRMAGVVATRNAIVDLEAWADKVQGDTESYIRHLTNWAVWIERKLDPPRRMELTESCPVCNQDEYKDEEGRAMKFPIVIEFRGDRPGDARGICRACNNLWSGVLQLRELRWMLPDSA